MIVCITKRVPYCGVEKKYLHGDKHKKKNRHSLNENPHSLPVDSLTNTRTRTHTHTLIKSVSKGKTLTQYQMQKNNYTYISLHTFFFISFYLLIL